MLCLLAFGLLQSPIKTQTHPVQNETEEAAAAAIEEATSKLYSAFEEVRKADKAGATVKSLVDELNAVENHLGMAMAAKEDGQFVTAVSEATLAIQIAERVEQKAKDLRREAEQIQLVQWVLIPLALTGLILGVFWAFRWLKPRLERRKERMLLERQIQY